MGSYAHFHDAFFTFKALFRQRITGKVRDLQRKTQRKPKRVRDTSLRKFHHTDGREVGEISPMCPDMGSACFIFFDILWEGL